MSVKKNLQKKRDRVKRIRQDRARQSQLIDAQWNLDLALDALRLRDYEKAGLHVEKALHLKPDWHHALRLKAMIALEIPKPDIATACSCLEKIVQKDPNDVITMFSLADLLFPAATLRRRNIPVGRIFVPLQGPAKQGYRSIQETGTRMDPGVQGIPGGREISCHAQSIRHRHCLQSCQISG